MTSSNVTACEGLSSESHMLLVMSLPVGDSPYCILGDRGLTTAQNALLQKIFRNLLHRHDNTWHSL